MANDRIHNNWERQTLLLTAQATKRLECEFGHLTPDGTVKMSWISLCHRSAGQENEETRNHVNNIGEIVRLAVKGYHVADDGTVILKMSDADKTDGKDIYAYLHRGEFVKNIIPENISDWTEPDKHIVVNSYRSVIYPRELTLDTEKMSAIGVETRLALWQRVSESPVKVCDNIKEIDNPDVRRAILEHPTGTGGKRIETQNFHGWTDKNGIRIVYGPSLHNTAAVDRYFLQEVILKDGLKSIGLDDNIFLNLLGRSMDESDCLKTSQKHGLSSNKSTLGRWFLTDTAEDLNSVWKEMGEARARHTEPSANAQRRFEDARRRWKKVMDAAERANPRLAPLCEWTSDSMIAAFANAIDVRAKANKIFIDTPEGRQLTREEANKEFNAEVEKMISQFREDPNFDMNPGKIYYLGTISPLLYSTNRHFRPSQLMIRNSAIFGKDGIQNNGERIYRDKQQRHYSLPYMKDLVKNLEDPLIVFSSTKKDDFHAKETVEVILNVTEPDETGEASRRTFMAPIAPNESLNTNEIRTYYSKSDMVILMNLAGLDWKEEKSEEKARPGILTYLAPDFEKRWYNDARRLYLEFEKNNYEETLKLNGPDSDGTKIAKEQYEEAQRLVECCDKRIAEFPRYTLPKDVTMFRVRNNDTIMDKNDRIGRYDAALAVMGDQTPQRIALKMREDKKKDISDFLSGISTTPFSVCLNEDIENEMRAAGCTEKEIESVTDALDSGIEITGMAVNGRVFIFSDNIHSAEQVRTTYVHERQHLLTIGKEKATTEAISKLISRDEAYSILSLLSETSDVYRNRSKEQIFGEAVSYAMEMAYKVRNEDIPQTLYACGIKNEIFISFIKNKDYEQRLDNTLSRSRSDAPECIRFTGRSTEPDGIPERQSAVFGQTALGTDLSEGQQRDINQIAALSEYNKQEGIFYPAVEMPRLEMAARTTKQTTGTISGWFDKWYDVATKKNLYNRIEAGEDAEPLPTLLPIDEDKATEEEVIAYKKTQEEYEKAKKSAEKQTFLNYIDTLNDNGVQLAAAKWFCSGTVRLPEDESKIIQAVKTARNHHLDPLQYEKPMEIINKFPDKKKDKADNRLDPKTTKLTNRKELANGIVIYDAPDEAREDMRRIIDSHLGYSRNPWCLLARTGGTDINGSRNYWFNTHTAIQKKAAFVIDETGHEQLLAFQANSHVAKTWWDETDSPHENIIRRFVTIRDKNLESPIQGHIDYSGSTGRIVSKTELLDIASEEYAEYEKIARERDDEFFTRKKLDEVAPGKILVQKGFDMGGNISSVTFMRQSNSNRHVSNPKMTFYVSKDGEHHLRTLSYVNSEDEKDGEYMSFYENGQLKTSCTYNVNRYRHRDQRKFFKGDFTSYYENGSIHRKGVFTDGGVPKGVHIELYPNGRTKTNSQYDNDGSGKLNSYQEYDEDGTVLADTIRDTVTIYFTKEEKRKSPDHKGTLYKMEPKIVAENGQFIYINGKRRGLVGTKVTKYYINGKPKEINEGVMPGNAYSFYSTHLTNFRPSGTKKGEVWFGSQIAEKVTKLYTEKEDGTTYLSRIIFSVLIPNDYRRDAVLEFDADGRLEKAYQRKWFSAGRDAGYLKDGPEITVYRQTPTFGSISIRNFNENLASAVKTMNSSMDNLDKILDKYPFFKGAMALATLSGDSDMHKEYTKEANIIKTKFEKPKKDMKQSSQNEDLPFRVQGQENLIIVDGEKKRAYTPYAILGQLNYFSDGQLASLASDLNMEFADKRSRKELLDFFKDALLPTGEHILTADEYIKMYDIIKAAESEKAQLYMAAALHADRQARLQRQQETAEKSVEERKLGTPKAVLNAQIMSALQRHIANEGKVYPPQALARTIDGQLIGGVNMAVFNMEVALNNDWLPVFGTREEFEALGIKVYDQPGIKSLYLATTELSDGSVRTKQVYNIADTDFPDKYEAEWSILKKYFNTMLPEKERVNLAPVGCMKIAGEITSNNPDLRCDPKLIAESIDTCLSITNGSIRPCYHMPKDAFSGISEDRIKGMELFEMERLVGKAVSEHSVFFTEAKAHAKPFKTVLDACRHDLKKANAGRFSLANILPSKGKGLC